MDSAGSVRLDLDGYAVACLDMAAPTDHQIRGER
jgi:hypothetical protein